MESNVHFKLLPFLIFLLKRSRWTPDYIVSKTPMLAKVQKHKDKTFSYFHEDHPMSGYLFQKKELFVDN
jgi:hypothetical protein